MEGGKIVITQKDKTLSTYQVPLNAGSVENLFTLPNNDILVVPSRGLYLLDLQERKLIELIDFENLNKVAITDTTMLFAFSQKLVKLRLTQSIRKYLYGKSKSIKDDMLFKDAVRNMMLEKKVVIKNLRYNLMSFDTLSKKTYTAFKFELASLVKDSTRLILYKNKTIRSICILQCDGYLYSGTLNIGNSGNYDHIVPLAKGGLNDVTNLQLLCSTCNLSKAGTEILTSDQYEAWY